MLLKKIVYTRANGVVSYCWLVATGLFEMFSERSIVPGFKAKAGR